MDIRTHGDAPFVRVVHLFPRIDEERDVLDSDVVVMMLAPVSWS
jgi:hypothetical protein